jgi:SAM-dependent methyltransferase
MTQTDTDAPDTTYESYAQDPDYIAANSALIDSIDLDGVTWVADLACGTGLLSHLLLEREPMLIIGGIDLDPVQVGLSTQTHTQAGRSLHVSLKTLRAAGAEGKGGVWLTEGSAMALPFDDNEIDLVVMGNAIHMMPDRPAFLTEVARVLRSGGRIVFNSVFYAGTFVAGSEPVFTECMKEAVIVLNEMNAARRAAGEPPIPRQRGTAKGAFQQTDWLTPQGWADALAEAGIHATHVSQREMMISREGMEKIGSYGGLAEVLMSGYPVDIAAHCMQQGIRRAFINLDIANVPRNWLEVIAERR